MIPAFHESPMTYVISCSVLLVSMAALRSRPLFHKLSFYPYGVFRGRKIYTLFTSVWVHTSYVHLLVNEVFLFFFLSDVEYMLMDDFGRAGGILLLVSLLLGIVAITGLLDGLRRRKDHLYTSAGASGLVFGLVMFYFFYLPLDQFSGSGSFLPQVYSYQVGSVYFIFLSLLVLLHIGRSARIHWYGALAGLILVAVFRPLSLLDLYQYLRA